MVLFGGSWATLLLTIAAGVLLIYLSKKANFKKGISDEDKARSKIVLAVLGFFLLVPALLGLIVRLFFMVF